MSLDPQLGDRVADVAAAPGRQGHRHRRARRARRRWWSRSTSTPAACGSSTEAATGSVSTPCTRSSPTGARCRCAPSASIACCSTHRAAGSACCGDAPTRAGASASRRSASWRALQRDLLAAAAALVRPGGVLVYSVCTLTRAETVDVDEWAAQHLDGFDALAPPARPGDRSVVARSSSRRRPAPTECSCSRSSGTPSVRPIDRDDDLASSVRPSITRMRIASRDSLGAIYSLSGAHARQ